MSWTLDTWCCHAAAAAPLAALSTARHQVPVPDARRRSNPPVKRLRTLSRGRPAWPAALPPLCSAPVGVCIRHGPTLNSWVCPPPRLGRVTDQFNFRVQKLAAGGRFLAAFGLEGRAAGRFKQPLGIALLTPPAGVLGGPRVAVSDAFLNNVQLFDPTL